MRRFPRERIAHSLKGIGRSRIVIENGIVKGASHMKRLNFKFVTTAGFLLSALLIAGCASQGVSEEPAESEQTRQFHFREDGTGYVVLAEGEEQTFEFALEGDHLTIVPEDGAVELYQCTMENATMYLTRINNDGTLQTLREVYAQSDVQPDPVPDAAA